MMRTVFDGMFMHNYCFGPVVLMSVTLYYFYDPMCSWCWGFKPTWTQLCEQLPEHVAIEYVAGGLAPDSDQPMSEDMQLKLPMTWQQIQRQLGTEFNFDFWRDCQPRRSTYPACRAVIAAGLQGQLDAMINAVQRGYYLRALNPSNLDMLEQMAQEIGLDTAQFKADMAGERVEQLFQAQLRLTSQMPVQGFPSLVLKAGNQVRPIALNYTDATAMQQQILALCAD